MTTTQFVSRTQPVTRDEVKQWVFGLIARTGATHLTEETECEREWWRLLIVNCVGQWRCSIVSAGEPETLGQAIDRIVECIQ